MSNSRLFLDKGEIESIAQAHFTKILESLEMRPFQQNMALMIASEWLDEGTRVIFPPNVAVLIYEQIKKTVPLDVLNAIGAGWNFFDAVAGTASATYQYSHLTEVERRQKEKAGWATYDLLMSNVITSGTILTLLAQHGVLHGVFAAAATPLGGIAFAIAMWGGVARASLNLYRAVRKRDSKEVLLEDRLIKIENIQNKIEVLKAQKSELAMEINKTISHANELNIVDTLEEHAKKMATLNRKIKRWQQVKDRLTLQTHAIISNEPNTAQKKVLEELRKNQNEKIAKYSVSTVAWTLAAIGMTLIAIAPFTGPAAPALATAGIAIAAIAGAIKLGEAIGSRLTNAIAKWDHKRHMRLEFRTNRDNEDIKILNELGIKKEDQLRYRISYQQLITQHPDKKAEEWYGELSKMDEKRRKKILTIAEKKYMEQQILDRIHKNNDFVKMFSEKEKERIVNRAYRTTLTSTLSQLTAHVGNMIYSIFKKTHEQKASAQNLHAPGINRKKE